MSKSANNVKELNKFRFDSANNRIDFNVDISTNNQTILDQTVSGSIYANGAFVQANTAYETLNTNPILNRGEYIQANNTINFNVAITANGSDIAGGPSPFLLMGA
jgi:hypothetical protein